MNEPLREHLIDGVKAAPVVGFWTTWFWGVNWTVVGAFLMALYTLLLILDKLGLLNPMRAFFAKLVAALLLMRTRPPATAPPGVRTAQDE